MSKIIAPRHRILIDVDCIFDVLYTCVAMQSHSLADTMVAHGYLQRHHDVLTDFAPGINMDLLKRTFDNRTDVHLSHSYMTEMVHYLADRFYSNSIQPDDHPEKKDFYVCINTAPYKLTDDECVTLCEALSEIWFPEELEIDIEHRPKRVTTQNLQTRFITPMLLKTKFEHYITYNIDPWFVCHVQATEDKPSAINRTPIPDVLMSGPLRIVPERRHEPYEGVVEESFRAITSNYIDLEFLPMNLFSISSISPEESNDDNKGKTG